MEANTYTHERVIPDDPFLENEVPERRDADGTREAVQAELPCLFPFSSACIHTCHQEDDV